MADPNHAPLAPPPDLRAAIARDLAPVTPLARPIVRAAWLIPIGLALLVASALIFGVRRDVVRLGWALTWGASVVEMVLGLAVIAAALREAVPGTTLSRRALGWIFAGALGSLAAITVITWRTSPVYITRGHELFIGWICFAGTFVSALPPLAISMWLARRAYPLRPALTGAICGLGSGILADAGWRIFCHFSDPAHVFGAHIAAVVATAAIGALAGSRLKTQDSGWLRA